MSSTPLVCVPQCYAKFHPSLWGDYFINVSTDETTKLKLEQEAGKLKVKVKRELLESANKPREQLDLIDAIERLGVFYHFETEIEEALEQLYPTFLKECDISDLYHVSLGFRIFRQHGIKVPCAIFKRFKTEEGFKDSISNDDLEGILSLYEACQLGYRKEDIVDEALAFATAHLQSVVDKRHETPLMDQVLHALHQPLHKGIIRVETKHYISFYEQNPKHNKTLLRFAKLDYNLLQSLHQMEMKELSIWWKDIYAKLPFTRDRSVEGFFWALGGYYEPQYKLARKIFTKKFMIMQILDDIFDSLGTIEQKQLVVDAVHRWDYGYVNELPKYFNDAYEALLETYDEADEELTKEGKPFYLHYYKEQMKRSCKAWFKEAEWCNKKIVPTYDEYLENAIVSIVQQTGICAAFIGMGEVATKQGYDWVIQDPMPLFVRASAIILRLMNDIGGHKFEQTREHVSSAVECYMGQYGVSDEVQVYEELEQQVKDAWKDVNETLLKPYAIPKPLVDRILNFARVPEVMYKARTEGYTLVNETIRQKIASVLIHPIPI